MRFEGGAIIFGRVAGLEFSIDWSWLILVYFRWQAMKTGLYRNPGWWVLEFAVFMAAVLLADIAQIAMCRFVGGRVTKLRLSFLSRGIDLSIPQRPTPILLTFLARAVVWSMLTAGAVALNYASERGMLGSHNDFRNFIFFEMILFVFLAVYNILPAYPNDGGQVLRSILWYFMGPAWSLRVAAAVGLAAVCGLAALAIHWKDAWLGFIAVMMAISCIQGFRMASMLAKIQRTPRRTDYHCPKCGANPPESSRNMRCPNGHVFDFFACAGVCPVCGIMYETAICVDCQVASSPRVWAGPVGTFPVAPPIQPKSAPAVRSIIDVDGKPNEPK